MRQVVNWELLEMQYNEKTLKNLYNHTDLLLKNAERGCSVSMDIMVDLDAGLNLASLEEIERNCIILSLVERVLQIEVADMLGVSQRMVSHYVKRGIKKIEKYLNGVD